MAQEQERQVALSGCVGSLPQTGNKPEHKSTQSFGHKHNKVYISNQVVFNEPVLPLQAQP